MVRVGRFAVVVVGCLAVLLGGPAYAAVFSVNSGNDLDDGLCDHSHCSFREAINASNGLGGLDEIHFSFPGQGPHVITGTSGFPQITDSVTIDGYTQPGSDREKGHPNVVFTGDYWSGLHISAPGVTVRGLVIQGFNWGLRVAGSNASIQGNFIGTDAQGTGASGTANYHGIWLQFADDALVGGPAPGDRNLVSGNLGVGIHVSNSSGVVIQGNQVGVDLPGRAVLPNLYGIYIGDSSYDCVIGGAGAGEGNLVAGNTDYEVRIGGGTDGTAAQRIVVQGNVIGTDRTGALDLGSTYGVTIGYALESAVGGPNPGEGNLIAFNAKGIVSSVFSGSSFSGNRIYNSGTPYAETLGIDVENNGVSANDPCDANNLQNFPDLTDAASTLSSVTINGLLDSAPVQEYVVEFFASRQCDPLGYGEGESYLGRATVVTGPTCLGSFSATLPVGVPDGMAITATATGPDGSTSEFSACVAATGPPASGRVPDGTDMGTAPLTVIREASGDLTLSWAASCHPNDTDYGVYEGTLGAFYDHQPVSCSTGGSTAHTFTPGPDSHYYLVVPAGAGQEGSYGRDSAGAERPQLAGACSTQSVGADCP